MTHYRWCRSGDPGGGRAELAAIFVKVEGWLLRSSYRNQDEWIVHRVQVDMTAWEWNRFSLPWQHGENMDLTQRKLDLKCCIIGSTDRADFLPYSPHTPKIPTLSGMPWHCHLEISHGLWTKCSTSWWVLKLDSVS